MTQRYPETDERCDSFADVTVTAARPERELQMAEFSIRHDGLRYHYKGYRYDRWQDAAAYARLLRSRPAQLDAGGPHAPGQTAAALTDAEHALMTSLDIRFDDGAFRFGGYRYDALSDAVASARRASRDLDGTPRVAAA